MCSRSGPRHNNTKVVTNRPTGQPRSSCTSGHPARIGLCCISSFLTLFMQILLASWSLNSGLPKTDCRALRKDYAKTKLAEENILLGNTE